MWQIDFLAFGVTARVTDPERVFCPAERFLEEHSVESEPGSSSYYSKSFPKKQKKQKKEKEKKKYSSVTVSSSECAERVGGCST